ncbi:MAG: hypothetical protein R3F11_06155 [Verrucomicrobiales bacterium]
MIKSRTPQPANLSSGCRTAAFPPISNAHHLAFQVRRVKAGRFAEHLALDQGKDLRTSPGQSSAVSTPFSGSTSEYFGTLASS